MSSAIKIVKGMKDILPEEMAGWYFVEEKLRSIAITYGYQEIRMPLLESTDLFKRAIGEVTDIVEKEMYTFIDKGGDSLTLRPESTAQTVRYALNHALLRNQSQRFWYQGAMFRRENPQKGRYRQFTQWGIEALGLEGPDVDIEQLLMVSRLWGQLGLKDEIVLQLNSLGTAPERARYRQALVDYLTQHQNDLDEDSQRRLQSNPLRILDSKNPALQNLINNAPVLLDYLEEPSLIHFEQVQAGLSSAGVAFEKNPRLVRGIDYYTHTVYEWVTQSLGSQGTVCAGGRYNDLVAQLGGPSTPAVGFSVGVERLIMLLNEKNLIPLSPPIDIYLVALAPGAQSQALLLAERLRNTLPTLRLLTNCGGTSFKSQFKRADKSGARWALILGEEEIRTNTFSLKPLRDEQAQQTLTFEQLHTYLQQYFTR